MNVRSSAVAAIAVLGSFLAAVPAGAQMTSSTTTTTDNGDGSLLWVWVWILVIGVIAIVGGACLGNMRGGKR